MNSNNNNQNANYNPYAMRNPYAAHDTSSRIVGIGGSAVGASPSASNGMFVVQNAQQAYHINQYARAQLNGNAQALANANRAAQWQRQMQTAQVQASSMAYGMNGITQANGFVRDANGAVRYVGVRR
ncbi:hypothetical protein BJY04DRAFT_223015 [Aspergillus karnatakaensis]|uniref:uncharacterized protein n=1 Tax=Aspergillus karnatakaensis TaxID=1810916 RepID=UPI003CCD2663